MMQRRAAKSFLRNVRRPLRPHNINDNWSALQCALSPYTRTLSARPQPVHTTHQRNSWFGGSEPEVAQDDKHPLLKQLYQVYKNHVVPLEHSYSYSKFSTPELTEADFLAAPVVLLLGQYSTGKTSMLEYLVGTQVPGSHTGPEPTTDKFIAVMHGDTERVVPGHAACSEADLPFKSLQTYGSSFLSKFEVAQVKSPLLQDITFLDSPGVLSGEKQRVVRGYDFAAVTQHFAERADRIILLFDCSKLDISDEFEEVVKSLDGNNDKVRCLLNKADQVDSQELFRVYGALLWSLGKVVNTPEVLRVFVASMWDHPYMEHAGASNHELFDRERESLLNDLNGLPQEQRMRRINETIKRWRAVKTHAVLCSHLSSQFGWIKKGETQKKLLKGLEGIYADLARRHGLNVADFPDPDNFRRVVGDLGLKMWEWNTSSEEELSALDKVVSDQISPLIDEANKTRV